MTPPKKSPLPGRKSGELNQRIEPRLAGPANEHKPRWDFVLYLRRYRRFSTAELERQVPILNDRIFKAVARRAAALTELERRAPQERHTIEKMKGPL
jgi:hypothetical protein